MLLKRIASRYTSFPKILALYLPSIAICLLLMLLQSYDNVVTSYNHKNIGNIFFLSAAVFGIGALLLQFGARYFAADADGETQAPKSWWAKPMAVLATFLGLIPAVPIATPVIVAVLPPLMEVLTFMATNHPCSYAADTIEPSGEPSVSLYSTVEILLADGTKQSLKGEQVCVAQWRVPMCGARTKQYQYETKRAMAFSAAGQSFIVQPPRCDYAGEVSVRAYDRDIKSGGYVTTSMGSPLSEVTKADSLSKNGFQILDYKSN